MAGILINRAPVLTLWAAVVAERRGYDRPAALSLGRAMAGLTAQTKGRLIGIYEPRKKGLDEGPPRKTGLGEDTWVTLCGRSVPARNTAEGLRAVSGAKPITPEEAQRYLESKFGDNLPAARQAMESLAAAFEPDDLEEIAFSLYERFRPQVARGQRGWGQKGELDLDVVRSLAKPS